MSRHLLIREWRRLCERVGHAWRQDAGIDEMLTRTRHRSELVERGTRYGVDVLREIKSRLPTVEATLPTTIEETLWRLVEGSEDWDVIEERVDSIVMAELLGGATGWTPQDASF